MTHFSESRPVARVQHRCDMCRRVIQPGEVYRRGAGMDGSSAWTWKECAHCAAFVSVAYRRADYDEGYDEEVLLDFEPESIAEARVRAQWRRRWSRLDGSLYPAPKVQIYTDPHGFSWPVGIAPGVDDRLVARPRAALANGGGPDA